MKLISNLLTLFLQICCTEDSFDIQEVLILENNYWGENRAQTKTDKGFLTEVKIKIMNVNNPHLVDKCIHKYCFFDKEKQKQCFLLNNDLSNAILSNIRNKKRLVLRIQYTYTNYELIYEGSLGTYFKNRKYYDNHKILGENNEGVIRFEDAEIESYLSHIKFIFSKIVDSGFIVLENFNSAVDKYLHNQTPDVKIYYFKSFPECVQSFRNFINFFNFQNFDDDSLSLKNKSCSNNFNASFLQNYLQNKFNIDYKEGQEFDLKFLNIIELLYKGCHNELERNLLPSYILLPFKNSFTIDFYFDKFFCLIKEVIEEMMHGLDPNNVILNVELQELIKKFKTKVINMYEELIFEIWESFNASEYFSALFGSGIEKIEDYIEVDKVMCDYHNIICCINGVRYQLKESEINFTNPMFNDEFECRLVNALQIKIRELNKLGEIIAYDLKENKNQLIENVDYFVIKSQKNAKVLIFLEKIREKNLETIEIISKDKEFKRKFMINKYLN